MPRYRLVSIDKLELTEATGDVAGALRRIGGKEGVKKLFGAMLEGNLNAPNG